MSTHLSSSEVDGILKTQLPGGERFNRNYDFIDGEVYECPHCFKKFPTLRGFSRHLKSYCKRRKEQQQQQEEELEDQDQRNEPVELRRSAVEPTAADLERGRHVRRSSNLPRQHNIQSRLCDQHRSEPKCQEAMVR